MPPMLRKTGWFFLGAMLASLLVWLIYQIPPVKFRMEWRIDEATGIVLGWLYPGDTLPTPSGVRTIIIAPTLQPSRTPAPTTQSTAAPSPTPTPLPAMVALPAPAWEKQDWNNCGPATLAMALRFYGWQGDQFAISDLLKPDRGDKNVNVDELLYYVRTRAGWLSADYRVGGTIDGLKSFLASGFPVVVEKGLELAPEDGGGGWAGHYVLITGYDDAAQQFILQDANPISGGSDARMNYGQLDQAWKAFNRVFLFIYPPQAQDQINRLLGSDADPDANRERALAQARQELQLDPKDAYAWFNLGTNLLYFERYGEAASAYDTALEIGLPWRFTRYQFGPYIAYFNQGRFQDVIDLADATLHRTYKSEEGHLWRGWAEYRLGRIKDAEDDFLAALQINPNYQDAQYALNYIRGG
jgi:hypothetical protein